MKKSKLKIVLATIIAIPILILAVWSFWPLPSYDANRVCSQLRSLQTPYQKVKTVGFLDGGSVGIEIIDRNGQHEQFALPCGWDNTNYHAYSRVFVGALWNHRAGAIEITNLEPTKLMLVEILRDYPNRNAMDDASLLFLRRKPVDYARVLIHKWRGDFNSGTNLYIR
jgi:hypothetical protein